MKIEQIKKAMSMLSDVGYDIDKWDVFGSVMNAFFDLAEYMFHYVMDIPYAWQFRPGAGAPDMGENMFASDCTGESDCLEIGEFLHESCKACRKIGIDY